MNAYGFSMFGILMLISLESMASNAPQTEPTIDITLSKDNGSEFRLEARQAPLAQVLLNLSKKTGMQIHYSVLPEGFVTATCVGSSTKQLLECLLARKADLVFRYPKGLAKSAERQPTDAWILGAKYTTGLTPIVDICLSDQDKKPQETQQTTEQEEAQKRTEELLVKAKSKKTDERVAAISELLSQASPGDPEVLESLETALNDKDTKVRAQAISTYANLEGEEANAALQEALHDPDAWVRQMAVDSTNDKTLLQQAVNDSEEPIRSLALQKLKSLEE